MDAASHQRFIKILQLIRPGAQWGLSGDTLASLDWPEQGQTKPIQDEIDAGGVEIDKLVYKDQRKGEYPALGDQFDSLWKCLQVLKSNGVTLGADADDMITAVNAVKAKYPKPS